MLREKVALSRRALRLPNVPAPTENRQREPRTARWTEVSLGISFLAEVVRATATTEATPATWLSVRKSRRIQRFLLVRFRYAVKYQVVPDAILVVAVGKSGSFLPEPAATITVSSTPFPPMGAVSLPWLLEQTPIAHSAWHRWVGGGAAR